MTAELFEQVVSATGLSRLVGPFTVRRLLLRGNVVPPEAVTREKLAQALPAFEDGLRVYLKGEDYERAIGELRRLALD